MRIAWAVRGACVERGACIKRVHAHYVGGAGRMRGKEKCMHQAGACMGGNGRKRAAALLGGGCRDRV